VNKFDLDHPARIKTEKAQNEHMCSAESGPLICAIRTEAMRAGYSAAMAWRAQRRAFERKARIAVAYCP
jgi:hypothetical protein